MMSRSVISSPPIDSTAAAAAGIPLMRTPSSSSSAGTGVVDVMMAQCNSSSLPGAGCLPDQTLVTRPMTLGGPVAAAATVIHAPQNSSDSGLGQFVCYQQYYYYYYYYYYSCCCYCCCCCCCCYYHGQPQAWQGALAFPGNVEKCFFCVAKNRQFVQSVNQYSFIKGMPERRPKQFTEYNIKYNIECYFQSIGRVPVGHHQKHFISACHSISYLDM